MFRIQPWIVEFSRSVDFGKDRLRERGSLPVTFYVLTRVFPMANDNSRKFKQNQIIFCIQPKIVEFSRPVSYTHLDVYKRQELSASWKLVDNYLIEMIIMWNDYIWIYYIL